MPLHISEIGVHLAVGGSEPGAAEPSMPPVSGGGGGVALTPAQEDAIVSRCVQQVIANLKTSQER